VRRGALMFGLWGLWVAALAVTLGVWGEAKVPLIIFGGAAAAAALAAGYLVVRPPREDPPRSLADASAAPPLIAAGLVLAANGLAFGLWLVLIGAELAAFGVGLLVAELRRSRGG
jgi:hypothetical protein